MTNPNYDGVEMRCPDWPEGVTDEISGCGSTKVGPGEDGQWDCYDCGLFFHPQPVADHLRAL